MVYVGMIVGHGSVYMCVCVHSKMSSTVKGFLYMQQR